MLRPVTSAFCCVVIALFCSCLPPAASAKMEEWQDLQGNKFTGEPTELIGPFAIFRTGKVTGRRVALQLLAPQDCVRLNEALRNKPPRADKWANATGEATHELIGRVMQVNHDSLVPADLVSRPEPAVLLAVYSANAERFSWDMLTDAVPLFAKLRDTFPGQVDAVMYGVRHNQTEHLNMAISRNVPWLVTSFYEQGLLDTLNRFVPDAYSLVAFSRDGVPLFMANHPDTAATEQLFRDVSAFLDLIRPENPKSWAARTYYWKTVRPFEYSHGHADPMLIGNPLVKQGLVQRHVFHFEAEIQVAADGQVKDVKVLPDDMLPEKMAAPIADGLKKAVFVPAIQDGTFVDGLYLYHFRATL